MKVIALVVDPASGRIQPAIAAFIQEIRQFQDCQLVLVRAQSDRSPTQATTGLLRLERFVYAKVKKEPALQQVNDLVVSPSDRSTGQAHHPAEDVDLVIDCCQTVLSSDHPYRSRLGTIRCLSEQGESIFSVASGFWPVYKREPVTTFSICLQTPDQPGNLLIASGSISTGLTWSENQDRLQKKTLANLLHVLKRYLRDGIWTKEICALLQPMRSQAVTFRNQSSYLIRQGGFLLTLFVRHVLLHKRYRWQVAYTQGQWPELDWPHAMIIPNEPHCFLADPFIFQHEGKQYLLAEELDYRVGQGHIVAYELTEKGPQRLGIALAEQFHVSFPYLFRYQDKIYLCPETSASGDIRIYESIRFPLEWRQVQVAMRSVSAVDTMIMKFEDRWWLLTNIDSANAGDHASELHVFSADQPITDQWQPHPDNPVLFDASRARNGGLVRDGATLYRISQLNGFFQYGTGVAIQKIAQMTQTAYNEVHVQTIRPDFLPGLAGSHHLSQDGDWFACDFSKLMRV